MSKDTLIRPSGTFSRKREKGTNVDSLPRSTLEKERSSLYAFIES